MIGATPYFLAARSGQLEMMKLLVARGADLSLASSGRPKRAHGAGRPRHVEGPRLSRDQAAEVVKLAVQLGTPVNQAERERRTPPCMWPPTLRRDVIVQALVDSGAALDVRNHAGETPLTAALKPPRR